MCIKENHWWMYSFNKSWDILIVYQWLIGRRESNKQEQNVLQEGADLTGRHHKSLVYSEHIGDP